MPVLATFFSVRRGRDPFFKFFMKTIFPRQVKEYEEKFGIPCPPHQSTEAAIDTYEATTACLGVRAEPGGRWRVYAPHGLSDVFNLVVRPNPVLAPPGVYRAKTERWRRQWPALTVLPWPATA